jgi:hypothetical protein
VATYLDVLVELLTDPAERAAYLREPTAWLHDAGLGYLCGEDVIAAAPVLRGWLPDVAAALEVLATADPQLGAGETELDAAVRVLGTVLEKVPLADDEEPERASFG